MYPEVKQRIIDLDLNVLFAYKTFSDPEKGERFRLIFKPDSPIFNWDIAHAMLFLLQAMFPEYFDNNCTNVNRQFHGSNTIIQEEHPLFNTSVEIDKFFRIFEKQLKDKDSSNFARNMEKFSRDTGINLLNGIFHVRKVTLTDEQVKNLKKEQVETYNMNIFSDYHFVVKSTTCQKVFENDNSYENTEALYYYIIVVRQNRTENENIFYEICMSDNYTETENKISKKKKKQEHSEEQESQKIKKFTIRNTKTVPIKRTKINNWNVVEDKCKLYQEFVTGKRRLHHNELFGLSLSLMYLEGGEKRLLETIENYPDLYNREKDKNWSYWIEANKRANYKPERCENFCPYKDSCKHYNSMLNTCCP